MKSNHTSIAFHGVVLLSVVACCGCDLHDYTPSKESIRDSPFAIEPRNFAGIYGNSDVMCEVYQYTWPHNDKDAFWNTLNARIAKTPWTQTASPNDDVRYFFAVSRADTKRPYWNIGDTRVKIIENAGQGDCTVRVAVVFAGSQSKPVRFSLPDLEAEFADTHVWPRLEKN